MLLFTDDGNDDDDDDDDETTTTTTTQAEGSVLIASDGSGSKVRQLLVGNERGGLTSLPIAKVGMTLRLSEDQVIRLLPATDEQLLFQGCHPDTGCYAFYSTLSTPQVNGSAERLAKIKRFATAGTGFYQPLRDIVLSIPQDAKVLPVALADWPTVPWPNLDGRVTLLGNAAHPMAMCECRSNLYICTARLTLINLCV